MILEVDEKWNAIKKDGGKFEIFEFYHKYSGKNQYKQEFPNLVRKEF